MKAGDILNYQYTGKVQTVTLPKGKFKIECWGAQGGYRSSTSYGGKGGYAVGTLTLSAKTNLFVYVGGAGGNTSTNAGSATVVGGGFNGGGSRYGYKGGGGASDVRIGTDSLYARVIVAGGGGSDGASYQTGGYGGGTSGGATTGGYGSGGGGATQTAGGTGGSGNPGTFGVGGQGLYRSNGYGGAGGGGWYGGGGAYPDSSGDDDKGGGGGSGYVYTSSTAGNYPSGCLLNASYYLADASTTGGGSSFAAPGGSSETGHSGDGYVRITVIEAKPAPDSPTGLTASYDYYGVRLSWNASSGATGYRIRMGSNTYTTTATTYTLTGLSPSTKYTVTVAAYNADGESEAASVVFTTKSANLIQTAKTLQSVTIQWDKSSYVSKYALYQGSTLVQETTGNSITVTGLLPSHTYNYTLKIGSVVSGTIDAETEEGFYTQGPVFASIQITPNPTTINKAIQIIAKVEDKLVILEPEVFYSNEIYAGEV